MLMSTITNNLVHVSHFVISIYLACSHFQLANSDAHLIEGHRLSVRWSHRLLRLYCLGGVDSGIQVMDPCEASRCSVPTLFWMHRSIT